MGPLNSLDCFPPGNPNWQQGPVVPFFSFLLGGLSFFPSQVAELASPFGFFSSLSPEAVAVLFLSFPPFWAAVAEKAISLADMAAPVEVVFLGSRT